MNMFLKGITFSYQNDTWEGVGPKLGDNPC